MNTASFVSFLLLLSSLMGVKFSPIIMPNQPDFGSLVSAFICFVCLLFIFLFLRGVLLIKNKQTEQKISKLGSEAYENGRHKIIYG